MTKVRFWNGSKDERESVEALSRSFKWTKPFAVCWARWGKWEDKRGVIVAYKGKRLVGFLAMGCSNTGYVDDYFQVVHPEFQGRGISGSMHDLFFEEAARRGSKRLRFRVAFDCAPALNFWRGFGLQPFGTNDDYYLWDVDISRVRSSSELKSKLGQDQMPESTTRRHERAGVYFLRIPDHGLTIVGTQVDKVGSIWVKREDLATVSLGPPFSKTRGLAERISNVEAKYIAVLDTFHSYGGWAVAYVCKQLGKNAVIFYPKTKASPEPKLSQVRAKELGAEIVGLQAGRSAVLYHWVRAYMAANFNGCSYVIPNALKLEESVTETAQEVHCVPKEVLGGTAVISVSSGTLAAGVVKGLAERGVLSDMTVVLHMGYSRSSAGLMSFLRKFSGVVDLDSVNVVDEGYEYRDSVDYECSFPCNKYYDLKAWKWLVENSKTCKKPLLFWNIGAD